MFQLKVEGMTCAHCVASVTAAVRRVAPGAAIAVDLARGEVTVDGSADQPLVQSAIVDAGFDVTGTV